MVDRAIEIDVIISHRTEKAILVATDEDAEPVWLAKAMVEIEMKNTGQSLGMAHITMSENTAINKGLI